MTEAPGLANGDSLEYWKAAQEKRLIFQKCSRCGAVQFPPRHHCASCWEADLEWLESSGNGTVESFTIVRRAPIPEFRDQVPYVVASVRVEEGVRMITNLIGDDSLQVKIGDKVRVDFVDRGDGNTLPQFRLA